MSTNRRDFIKLAGVAGLAAATGGQTARASHGAPISDDVLGVLVDIPKCIGCRRCEFACKQAAQQAAEKRAEKLEAGNAMFSTFSANDERKQAARFEPDAMETFENKSVFERERLRRPEPRCHTKINRYDNPKDSANPIYTKVNCLHCNVPACVSACLVGAFRKIEQGPVLYDVWKCMGCRYCLVACPFAIPTYEYDNLFTPQVRKCTLCADEGNLLCDDEGNFDESKVPACIKACPQDVMTFGKRSELLKIAHEKIHGKPDEYLDHIYGEHEAGGTSWLYLAPNDKSFTEMDFLELDSSPPPLLTETIQHGVFKYFVPPVAWYGLLGAMMWITRPDANKKEHAPAEEQH